MRIFLWTVATVVICVQRDGKIGNIPNIICFQSNKFLIANKHEVSLLVNLETMCTAQKAI